MNNLDFLKNVARQLDDLIRDIEERNSMSECFFKKKK